jgi:hypothetical protein
MNIPKKLGRSEAARRIRTKASKLTSAERASAERAELHRRAMQLIDGGPGSKEAFALD